MKLELKHLAPYLPYGLGFATSSGKKVKVTFGYGGMQIFKSSTHPMKAGRCISLSENTFNRNYKPILRPLSDLIKKIEVDGDKFVPLKKIGFETSLDEWQSYFERNIKDKNLVWEWMELLFEWHFDVFGLIPEGLAIDINTLTK